MTTQYIIMKNFRTKHSLLTLDDILTFVSLKTNLYTGVSYSVTFLSFV